MAAESHFIDKSINYMWKAHYVFLFLFSCLTIMRIMGFHDYGVSGKYVLSIK